MSFSALQRLRSYVGTLHPTLTGADTSPTPRAKPRAKKETDGDEGMTMSFGALRVLSDLPIHHFDGDHIEK